MQSLSSVIIRKCPPRHTKSNGSGSVWHRQPQYTNNLNKQEVLRKGQPVTFAANMIGKGEIRNHLIINLIDKNRLIHTNQSSDL